MPVLKGETAEAHGRNMLPKLPVPDLPQTLNSYLSSVQHLVSETQFRKTKAIVEAFGKPGGVGENLQKQLLERREETENWVYDVWLDDMYLKNGLALPVHSSPALVLPRQPFRDVKESLAFAARLILSVSQYKTALDGGTLPVDAARGQKADVPLCMDQYRRLFSSYRRPGREQDSILTTDAAAHVIVACRAQLFVLNLTEGSRELSEAEVEAQLQTICEQTQEQEQPGLGILTSSSRREWSRVMEELLTDAVNRECVELLERCVCVVCLDAPAGLEPSDANRAALMLTGGERNGANRWYDKPLQLVVGADGVCGVVCEHAALEGIVLVQCVEQLLKHTWSRSGQQTSIRSGPELPRPRRLTWSCSPRVTAALASAAEHRLRLEQNLDVEVLVFSAFGKEWIKGQRVSPDAFIQVALQLAFYRCHRRAVSTYESASLRHFRRGRVENIRSGTAAALAFARAQTDGPQDSRRPRLAAALEAQARVTAQAVSGQGMDNHLLGLREMAKEMNMETPDIFSDETYRISNHFTLSTSQVPTTLEMFCCYGPVVADGYGVCYNPQPDHVVFCVSSFRETEDTSSGRFAAELERALRDMRDLCAQHPEK